MAYAEMDMKANLADLSKIPVKEFEKHFRDWMERDDVARALQAKLRTDLILNFNKTALGRQILAQTTTTTTGGSTQRLTLSPLVLALNTLVAEFLYAQNCHFSLSVFCTEVPFRNTLPDFENAQHFRFTNDEIKEILEAIFDKTSNEAAFKNSIIGKYESNKNVSLLMLIMRYLLRQKEDCARKLASFKSEAVTKGTQTAQMSTTPYEAEQILPPQHSPEARKSKTEMPNSHLKYLNKYLMILSTKVKEMSEQFEEMRKQPYALPSTRLSKSVRTRRYDKLNRSLERITSQLKQMTHTKRKSKQVVAVVSAVDALAAQFSKCVESFRSVSRELIASNEKQQKLPNAEPHKPQHTQAAVQVDLSCGRIQGGKENRPAEEKTYTDWVHEMRHTKNGQKFLDRIEVSLKKALNRQRELLRNESEEKLQHQKQLLKIQYKEKLMEHFSHLPAYDYSREARKLNESIGQQLQEFESRHSALLQKMEDDHKLAAKHLPTAVGEIESEPVANAATEMNDKIARPVVKEMEPTKTRDPVLHDAVNTQKQLQKMVQSIAQQERTVDQIVHDARMRIQELENESNQLELNFRNYLERQRLQAETMREVVSSLSENHKNEKHCLKYSTNNRTRFKSIQKTSELKTENTKKCAVKPKTRNKAVKPKDSLEDLTDQENKSPNFKYPNAILDAKSKLFKSDGRCHYLSTKQRRNDDEALCEAGIESFYYNRHFGRHGSHSNLAPTNVCTGQANQMPTMPLSSTDVNCIGDANALSARGSGKALDKGCKMLPNTSASEREEPSRMNTYSPATIPNTKTSRTLNPKSLPPLPDAPIPTVIGSTTMSLTVATVAAANGARNENEVESSLEVLANQAKSETSTSTNGDGNLPNKSTNCDSSNANRADQPLSTRVSGNIEQKIAQGLLSEESKGANQTGTAGFEANVYAERITITKNPVTNAVTLIETMERMQRLFTESPTNATKRKWQQEREKIQQNQKLQQRSSNEEVGEIKEQPQTVSQSEENASKNACEKPSTSAERLLGVNAEKNKTNQNDEIQQTSKSEEESNQPLNTFVNTASAVGSITKQEGTTGIIHQAFNIAASNKALVPTISSTTFSIRVDADNLKESVSESSIEIASMAEAASASSIELADLIADAEEDDSEADVEEEEPMGGIKIDTASMPAIEEVSDVSSSSSSLLSMSQFGGGGGGAVQRKQSDSGSDFW
ncbi:uncharacterized protein LOC128856992 [Anastrepha ludens]|uniref:uncharacterized protein LOC128856992 n=1 Tax=Anastrepha ludens TaxID=28586 RepID=UPI0023AFD0F1|nr:uncharacterized protein LOC128856992 [Anastrepha ludens]